MKNSKYYRLSTICCCSLLLVLLAACGPTFTTTQGGTAQQTTTIKKSFQASASPIPTVPLYRCGAWASANNPGTNSTIIIFSRLMNNHLAPISGATATAVVHFQSGDQPLGQAQTSDSGGYVRFPLPLQGRQPSQIPATVSITFSNIPGSKGSLNCTPAFFTPQ